MKIIEALLKIRRGVPVLALLVFALAAPQSANALWGCLFANPGCNWVYYDTELTCADITLSSIGIQACVDDPAAPGGGTGQPGALVGIHPDFDGGPNIGEGPFPGTIEANGRTLDNFIVTRPIGSVVGEDPIATVLAFDASGNIFRIRQRPDLLTAEWDALIDAAIQVTPGGEEILSPFDFKPTGRVAGGDITVSLHLFEAGDGSMPAGEQHWEITFAEQAWDYYGSGAVSNTATSWSAVKAMY